MEEGIPLVRVANTGITGITDAYGRVVVQTDLNKDAVIDSGLPVALAGATWYGRHGNLTFLVVTLLFAAMSRISLLFPDE